MKSPAEQIKATIRCSDEDAEAVVRRIGSLMEHKPTRVFMMMHCNVSLKHMTPGADQIAMNISEGRREVGLFIAKCAPNFAIEAETYVAPDGAEEISDEGNRTG